MSRTGSTLTVFSVVFYTAAMTALACGGHRGPDHAVHSFDVGLAGLAVGFAVGALICAVLAVAWRGPR